MKNKTAIITGASSGIGQEIARFFINKNFNVVLNSSSEFNLIASYEELGKPTNAICIVGDISNKETGKSLAEEAFKKFNSIDILINNAGIFEAIPFLEVSEEDLDRYWNINLKGTYFTSQSVIPYMMQQGGGSIVNMGTVLVNHTIANAPTTAPIVSKAAIHALTRHLAAEFGKYNIRVNTIAPGIIRSPLLAKNGVKDPDSLGRLHLLNRIGEPIAIAEAAYFLALSDFITGETINVDGGQSAGHYA